MKHAKELRAILGMTLVLAIVLNVCSAVVRASATDGVVITPEVIEGTLYPGETEYGTITVELPPSVPKGDVVFIFDATGSMRWIIADMQTKAMDIMNAIRAVIPDTAFGVGSFCDYPGRYVSYGYSSNYGSSYGGDYAFKMDIDITLDIAAVSTAMNSIVYGSGMDIPEDYTRAVWESLHYSWREGAKRIVVLFGDAPPHSAPSGLTLEKPWAPPGELLFSSAYGGDPGPDEIMFTDDDLDYGPVVQGVKDVHITFVCVDCQSSSSSEDIHADDAHNNFNYLAYMTDGAVFPYTSETIADDIIARIEEITARPIGVLALEPDAAYAGWASWSPTAHYDVPWGTTVSFDVETTVPGDTLPGDYTFGIHVVGDGVILGTVRVINHIIIVNQPPVADAGGPYEGVEGTPIVFDASGSSDPDGDALEYRWDFDDDGSWDTDWSTDPTAQHTWGDDYSGTVIVEVSDGKLTDTDETTVTVTKVPPTVVPTDLTISLDPPSIAENKPTTVIISGRLTRRDTFAGISGVIHLSYSEGLIGEAWTDTNGYYSYSWENVDLGKGSYTITASFEPNIEFEPSSDTATLTVVESVSSLIPATINIDPDTLNLKSKGKWITCYIELPEGYKVEDIDIDTIRLNDTIPVEWGDIQDGVFMVKFDRSEVVAILSPEDEVELTVTGKLRDGTLFEGTDTIRVISKGK